MTSVRATLGGLARPLRAPLIGARPARDHVETLPRLRVVPTGFVPARVRQRRRRQIATAAVALLCLGALGVAAAHASLIQGQLRLQQLQQDVADQQARYQRLRLDVARLESPERIVSAAQQRLGMVPPPGVTYLSPTGPARGAIDDGGATDGSGSSRTAGWATVKPHLAPVNP